MVKRAVGEHLVKKHTINTTILPFLNEFHVSPDEHGGDPVPPRGPGEADLDVLLLPLRVLPLGLVVQGETELAWNKQGSCHKR